MADKTNLKNLKNFLISTGLSKLTRPFAPFLGNILMFHRVVTPDGKPRIPENQILEITPKHLKEIIAFYRQHKYEFVSMDEVTRRLNGKRSKQKFVAFTFDDGYTDTYTTAYPILKRENIPFSIYITTDFPDRKAYMWWNLLESALLDNEVLFFTLDKKEYAIHCETMELKREAFNYVRQLVLKSVTGIPAAWWSVFDPLGMDVDGFTDRLAMSWDQINMLGRDPLVTISAHTCTHPPLNGLDEEEALEEMRRSREIIQEKTGLPVVHFAYPYGSKLEVSDREARLAASLGFKSAVITEPGNIYAYHRNNRMMLPRVTINESDHLRTLKLVNDGCIPQTFNRF
jgi:peptidoglycan/xylan/chitin deacetylase (PgdA/CDA1 family)